MTPMKRALAPLAFLAGLTIAGGALAADFRLIDEDSEGMGIIDADGIEDSGRYKAVEMTVVLAKAPEGTASQAMTLRFEVDCGQNRARNTQNRLLDRDLKVIDRIAGDNLWQPAGDVSRVAKVVGHVCGREELPETPIQDLKGLIDDYLLRAPQMLQEGEVRT